MCTLGSSHRLNITQPIWSSVTRDDVRTRHPLPPLPPRRCMCKQVGDANALSLAMTGANTPMAIPTALNASLDAYTAIMRCDIHGHDSNGAVGSHSRTHVSYMHECMHITYMQPRMHTHPPAPPTNIHIHKYTHRLWKRHAHVHTHTRVCESTRSEHIYSRLLRVHSLIITVHVYFYVSH